MQLNKCEVSWIRSFLTMDKINRIEESITESLINVLSRASVLEGKDKLALAKEYKEWLNGQHFNQEILIIDEFTFDNCNF